MIAAMNGLRAAVIRAVVKWSCVAAIGVVSLPAVAQTASQASMARAKTLFENGRRLFKEEHYSDAIVAWKEGYKLSNRPLFLYNIGLAYEKQSFLIEALEYINRYRALAPSKEAEGLTKRAEALEARIDAIERTGIDPGREDDVKEDWQREILDLDDFGELSRPEEEKPKKRKRVSNIPVAPIALGGVGLASFVGAVVLGANASSGRKEAKTFCTEGDGWTCTSEAQPYLQEATGYAVGSDVLLLAGTGAVAAGVVIWIQQRKKKPTEPVVGAGWNDGPTFVVEGRF